MSTPGHLSSVFSTHYIHVSGRLRGFQDSLTFCLTLSSESGVSIEDSIRMVCAFEYARDRNPS